MAVMRPLSPTARRFLADEGRPASHDSTVLRRFQSWLDHSGLQLPDLDAARVRRFLTASQFRSLRPRTQQNYRQRLLRYLDWLFATSRLRFDPRRLRSYRERLPPLAAEFLAVVRTTRKETTRRSYSWALGVFHDWLTRSGRELPALDRRAMSSWLVTLQRRGLHPKTRVNAIQCVRIYLRWLRDHRLVPFDPDELIRSRDLPKLPDYLPRPLPPEADRQLQARLAASDSDYCLGLLLMRRTGLRIGELRDLEFDPLRTDPAGQVYLKVPLGKLDNERLVPLDDETHQLVRKLRSTGLPRRRWLVATPSGDHTRRVNFNHLLRQACDGLDIPEAINTHRLRHTYASSLLSAGISLVALMRLLGHRDFHMTLRYAAITPELVRAEFDQAFTQLEKRYRVAPPAQPAFEPLQVLGDLIRWTQKTLAQDQPRQVNALVKRLRRLRADLQPLIRSGPAARMHR
jgi:site-specific recombinase XerD